MLKNAFDAYICYLYLEIVVLSVGDVCVNAASAALGNTAAQQKIVTAAASASASAVHGNDATAR